MIGKDLEIVPLEKTLLHGPTLKGFFASPAAKAGVQFLTVVLHT
jgi:hypothetical protein